MVMIPARRSRISEIFAAARAQPEAQRAAFLSAACDVDSDLRAEVEALLARGESGSPSGSAADPPETTQPLTDHSLGRFGAAGNLREDGVDA
ncbi:MAG: hypothetical protein WBE38_12030, partial [Terracidiphilus sp.]